MELFDERAPTFFFLYVAEELVLGQETRAVTLRLWMHSLFFFAAGVLATRHLSTVAGGDVYVARARPQYVHESK